MTWAVEAGPTAFNGDGSSDPIDIAFDSGVGSDRLLVVMVTCYRDSGGGVVGITYNGVSMTLDVEVNANAAQEHRLYSLVAPATGSNTLSVDLASGTYPSLTAVVICFTGIEQTPTINDTGIASGFGDNQPVILDPTVVGDLCIFGASSSGNVTWTPDSGDTEFHDDFYNSDDGGVCQGASYRLADDITENGKLTATSTANSQGLAIAFLEASVETDVDLNPTGSGLDNVNSGTPSIQIGGDINLNPTGSSLQLVESNDVASIKADVSLDPIGSALQDIDAGVHTLQINTGVSPVGNSLATVASGSPSIQIIPGGTLVNPTGSSLAILSTGNPVLQIINDPVAIEINPTGSSLSALESGAPTFEIAGDIFVNPVGDILDKIRSHQPTFTGATTPVGGGARLKNLARVIREKSGV